MLLLKLSHIISEIMGLHFPEDRLQDLQRGITSAAKDFEFDNTDKFIEWIINTKLNESQIKRIVKHLTVGETYFFRDIRSFEILRDNLLPVFFSDLRKGTKELKIWCAGCSTGEEPYSLAIWLSSFIDHIAMKNIKIIATDINIDSLAKAEKGIYTEWSFRGTPSWVKSNYFKKEDNKYILNNKIKEMINFSYLNLIDSEYPSILNNIYNIDIILCRNVLMYFNKENYKKVVGKFYKSLNYDGCLLVSAVETSQEIFKDFKILNFPGLSVYKKQKVYVNNSAEDYDKNEIYQLEQVETLPEQPQYIETNYQIEPETIKDSPDEITVPDQLELDYHEAVKNYLENNYDEAEKILLKIFEISLDTNSEFEIANIIFMLVNIYANKRMFDKAIEWCYKGINFDKLDLRFHYFLANIFQEQDDSPKAIESLQKVLYIHPDFILAHFLLGNLYKQQDKITESLRHFNIALSLLDEMADDDIIPESEQMNAEQMKSVIKMQLNNKE